jgi:mannosyltransferase
MMRLQDPLRGRHAILLGLAIFLLNAGLKILFLDAQPIANDEPFTLFWAQQPLSHIWEVCKNGNNPPLHFVLEHAWMQISGWDVGSLRLPSLLVSSLAMMLLFLSGNQHFGLFGGIVAALLGTLSTEHIYYAHEARMYALLSLLTVLALDRYLSLAVEPRRWQHYLWLGLWNVLLIYCHFLGLWVVLAQALAWPLFVERKAVIGRLSLMLVGVGLAFAPLGYAFALRLQAVASAPTWVPAPHWTQLYGHINIFLNGPLGTVAIFGMLTLGVGWMLIGKKSRAASLQALRAHRALLIAIAVFAIVYLGIYMQSVAFSPAFIPRYLIFTSMAFYLAVAGLLHFLITYPRVQLAALVVIALAMLPGLQLNPSNHRDLKTAVAYIQTQKTPETALLIYPDYFDIAYAFHADLALFQDYAHFDEALKTRKIYREPLNAELPADLYTHRRLIFLNADADATPPSNGILSTLNARYHQVSKQHFEQIFDVYVFEQ